jgi:transposase-like protein
MSKAKHVPETLQQAIIYFSDFENCRQFMLRLRWPDGKVSCPRCGSEDVAWLHNAKVFKCYQKHAQQKFSLKVGTIFEDSPIALEKWLPVMWMVSNCKNGVSSYEIHRAIKVTQKTAWFMLQRARLAMQGDVVDTFGGEVEVDETYIGGLARNMHADVRKRKIQGRTGWVGKTAVFGLLERGKDGKKSKVHTRVIPQSWKDEAKEIIREVVEPGSKVYTDEHGAYHHLGSEGFQHAFVRHAEFYVDGAVHTNGIENFWSLLKRGIKGTYVSVEPFHMFRYLDEQAFRFNERFGNDGDRFETVMKQIVNKRLTYKELTGKVQESQTSIPEGL